MLEIIHMKKSILLVGIIHHTAFLSCHTYQVLGLENKTKEALLKQQEISALISKAELGDAKAQCEQVLCRNKSKEMDTFKPYT